MQLNKGGSHVESAIVMPGRAIQDSCIAAACLAASRSFLLSRVHQCQSGISFAQSVATAIYHTPQQAVTHLQQYVYLCCPMSHRCPAQQPSCRPD